MKTEEYTKHKDCSPEETVFRIRRILQEADLYPVLTWTEDEFDGVCSNRVFLDPVFGLGANGKGTGRRYAEASGFAELIERIQNRILHIKAFGPEESPYPISDRYPDEKDMRLEELVAQKDAFLENLFRGLGFQTAMEKKLYLQKAAEEFYSKTDGTIPVIPFADPTGDRVVWLPAAVLVSFCGSNGMSAGNTMEEALVQGFSEILERYSQSRILREGLTPPEIPAEVLQRYSLWPLIRQIEASGRYRVSVRDCSLGEGLPVTAVAIADRERGRFGVKFGCHPSFPISVERTLTEALQGKKLETFTMANALGNPEQVLHYDNFTNTAKTGGGFYPPSILGASPSWEFRPWTRWDCTSNREYLQKLLLLLREKGFTPLIRDASHLGFPSYFILVPGMSEIYERSRLRLRDVNAITKTRMSFRHFPDLNEEEETLLLRMIQFKQGSIIENGLDIISGLFLKGELFTSERVGAYLALKAEKYALAARLFDRASACVRDGKDKKLLACMAEYARVLGAGADREDALSATAFLFGREAAERVKEETENPADMLKKVFPQLNCYDCKNCPIAGLHCEYPAAAEILRKLDRAMVQSPVSQEALLEKLKGFAAQS